MGVHRTDGSHCRSLSPTHFLLDFFRKALYIGPVLFQLTFVC